MARLRRLPAGGPKLIWRSWNRVAFGPVIVMVQPVPQAHPISEQEQVSGRASSVPVMVAAGVAGLVLVGACALWFHYGTQVFFEMIRTGLAACF